MKRSLLYATLALATLLGSSCQKEEMGRVLTATIEQYEHNAKGDNGGTMSDSKVYVNTQHYACWNNGDTVRINGQEVQVSIDEETATLPIPQGMENQDITAYYPASNISSNMSSVTLPYEQLYRTDDQGRQVIHNPMAAYCPAGGKELRFRNLGALLKITLPRQEDGAVVHSITVKGSKDYPLCGTATLQFAGDHKPQLSTPLQNGCDSVTLTHINVALTTDRSFYIVVPAYSLFREITVSVALEREQGIIRRNRKTDDTFGHLLDRNHIGALTYNLDGTERTIGGKRVIFYTTWDHSTLTPQNMGTCDNSEYGVLVFANNVTAIGDSAFSGCDKLTSITLPEGVTTIGDNAFDGCWILGNITLPEGVTTIGDNAFDGCSNLTGITLPEGVTTIGDFAFNGCSRLNSITFPTSLTIIGDGAFQGCGFSYITWPARVTSIGSGVFKYCNNLTSITLPEGVTTIGSSAFSECENLSYIQLPEGVTTIGNQAFSGCALSSIMLPSSLISLGDYVFKSCPLIFITVQRWVDGDTYPITQAGVAMFEGCNMSNPQIRVHPESVNTYKAADGWSAYQNNISEY